MRNTILTELKDNMERFISGERISEGLGISRTAVWKHISALREEGYEIESMPRKGYRLLSSPDILTLGEIEEYLTTDFIGRKIHHYESLSSTNIEAKEIAPRADEGTIIIAEEQIGGKGRLGRSWISPKGKGILMSIILKPDMPPSEVAKLTLIGAAAVYNGLQEIGIGAKIKWPNDIIVKGKKICGILTEMGCELNRINYVLMGIGINANLNKEDFNEELVYKASSLKILTGSMIDRQRLTASILNHLESLYIPFTKKGDISEAISINRENSLLIGRTVKLIKGEQEQIIRALDIDSEGQLVVEHEDGSTEKIFSGEISIRGLDGYV